MTGGLRTQPFSVQGDLSLIDQSERPEVHWSPEAQAVGVSAGWCWVIDVNLLHLYHVYWCILYMCRVTILVDIYVRRWLRMTCGSLLTLDQDATCPYDMVQTSQGMPNQRCTCSQQYRPMGVGKHMTTGHKSDTTKINQTQMVCTMSSRFCKKCTSWIFLSQHWASQQNCGYSRHAGASQMACWILWLACQMFVLTI